MDIVYISDLKVDMVIGIFDWECCICQIVSLDLEMVIDICKVVVSDYIEDVLDYKSIGKWVIQFIEDSDFQLVEILVEWVVDVVCEEFGVVWLKLWFSKFGVL